MNNDSVIRILLIALACVVLLYLVNEYNTNSKKVAISEKFEEIKDPEPNDKHVTFQEPVEGGDGLATDVPKSVDGKQAVVEDKKGSECFPRDRLSASDLLPKDAANSKWAQANPAGQGSISDQNFLNAGYHVGVNTVGSSLRNANQQIRSDPIIQQRKVSPWMQTTITPDVSRRDFEVGQC